MEIDSLRRVPLFAALDDADMSALVPRFRRHTYPRGGVIFLEHEEGDALFVILSGRVKVTVHSEDGREIILSVLTEEDFFGEMSLLDKKPRSATAIAAEETVVAVLRQEDFLSVVQSQPSILLNLLSALSGRLRKANHRIESLTLLDVYSRVAGILLESAREKGIELPAGGVEIPRLTHQEIASMIGATRETVSRMMSNLQRQGYVEVDGKRIVLTNRFTGLFG